MNLRQLRYFACIAAEGNMTKAAASLNVAQTALGFQVKNLEAQLGTALLERHSRGVRLTRAGEALARHATAILHAVDLAIRDVRETVGADTPSAVVGVTPSIARLLGTKLVDLAGRAEQGPHLSFVEELSFQLISALLREELQFALAFNVEARSRLVRRALLEEPLYLVSSAKLGSRSDPVSIEEAVSTDLALLGARDIVSVLLHETAAYLSLDVNVAFELQSTSAIKVLVEKGVATTIAPYGLVAAEIASGMVAARRIDHPRMTRTLFIVRPDRPTTAYDERTEACIIDRVVKPYAALLHEHANANLFVAPQI